MKKKATLFVYGNILCRDYFRTTTSDNFDDVVPLAKPDDFDLSDAVIINGNLVCDEMDIKSHKIACTGHATAFAGSMQLSDRLTEEEKEKIIKMYKSDLAYARMYTKKMESATDPSSLQKATNEREIFVSGVRMLKTIFGSDLFNDKSE